MKQVYICTVTEYGIMDYFLHHMTQIYGNLKLYKNQIYVSITAYTHTQGEILEIGHTFSGCCVHAK